MDYLPTLPMPFLPLQRSDRGREGGSAAQREHQSLALGETRRLTYAPGSRIQQGQRPRFLL